MSQLTQTRMTPLTARLVALVLVCAFVLQSAVQAGQGCLSRVFTGACCCIEVELGEPSCCARAEESPAEIPDGPSVSSRSDCDCTAVVQPIAPVVQHSPDVATERSWERILFVEPVVIPSCAAVTSLRIDPRALDRPPDSGSRFDASFARIRLAQRGVAGLLSELCTLHR